MIELDKGNISFCDGVKAGLEEVETEILRKGHLIQVYAWKAAVKMAHVHTHTSVLWLWTLSRITQVSRYQNSKTNLDFTEARDSEWLWHQLGHVQICTSPQTDNHASTPPLNFYRPDALPTIQPNA